MTERTSYAPDKVSIPVWSPREGDGAGDRQARGLHPCSERDPRLPADGPLFRFSDTWQLVINTGTTIITFLMVFLIQATQNRDTEAVQVKLDELLRATAGAHNALLDLEQLEERELDQILAGYGRLAEAARADLRRGERDTGMPEVA